MTIRSNSPIYLKFLLMLWSYYHEPWTHLTIFLSCEMFTVSDEAITVINWLRNMADYMLQTSQSLLALTTCTEVINRRCQGPNSLFHLTSSATQISTCKQGFLSEIQPWTICELCLFPSQSVERVCIAGYRVNLTGHPGSMKWRWTSCHFCFTASTCMWKRNC